MTDLPTDDSTTAAPLGLTDRELRLPASLDPDTTYDVLINGSHVWSIQPGRDTEPRRGQLVARWPKALRSHLVGTADVVVHEHLDDTPLAAGHHVFRDDDTRTVSVTDKGGNPLVLDKYNRLTRPLSADDDDSIEAFLDQVEALMTDLRDKAGRPAFICYGTLLGAVRNGQLIGHDNDVDIAYLSDLPYPVDVVREGYRVERLLTEAGWTVRRGSGTRLNVRLTQSDGTVRFVDVFTAHWVDGVFYMQSDTGFRLPREAVFPLTTVELLGRPMPAPAEYEKLLAATYGPSWQTPDPSFKYETPRWLSRRFDGWFGGLRTNRKLWDGFYAGPGRKVPHTPTAFARWVAQDYASARMLVDLGCGNGRDAKWFARKGGRAVLAIDYALGMMTRTAAKQGPNSGVTREVLNVNDLRHVLSLGMRLSRNDEPIDLYGRFLLHALDQHGRENVFRLASMTLRRGGLLFLEFRTVRDARRSHFYRNPKRRFLDPDEVVAQIEAFGGRIVERVEGDGLAIHETEDPHVCRLVVSWSDAPGSAAG